MILTFKVIVNKDEVDSLTFINAGVDEKNKDNFIYKCSARNQLPFLISHNPKLGWMDLVYQALGEIKKRNGVFKR